MNTKIASSLIAVAAIFVFAVKPILAQTNTPTNAVMDTNAVASSATSTQEDSGNSSVRIDATGIHVGGANPVDINTPFAHTSGLGGVTTMVVALAPFAMVVAVIAIFGVTRHKQHKMMHETLRAAIDKGVPITPEMLGKIQPPGRPFNKIASFPRNDFRNGLAFIGVGIGAIIVAGKVGWILLLLGVAFLIASLFEKRNKNEQQPPQA